jgi:3-hydroxyacyl-CoA dehydrogenase / enoyl-CoA hydratase / 3-hydroxybutyryl-CoA epimerase
MPGSDQQPKHWQKRNDSSGICWLYFDKQDSSANVFSRETVAELTDLITQIENEPISGLVIGSAKETGFIAGADITEFQGISDLEEVTATAKLGQRLCQQVADLHCPTVAALNGFTLGGGLELALACDYRVAIDSYDRCIGLPEVQLGIHPGWGGTVRAVELLGAPIALDLMLTGRSLSPVEAERIGLVDRLAVSESLEQVAVKILADGSRPTHAGFLLKLLNNPLVRPWLARSICSRVRRRADPAHYPAPFAIIDLWRQHGGHGASAYAAEAVSIARLMLGSTSRNLVRVYFLRERLRNLASKSSAAGSLHVVGAGVMGGDIASWCALQGLTVSIQDRAREYVLPALDRARKLFKRRLKSPGAAEAAEKRLTVDLDGAKIGDAEVIIEAIVEQLKAKQVLFQELENKVSENAILASNTSSIQLEDIAAGMAKPERLVGIHFFNPVSRLPLVEVIAGDKTDQAVFDRAMSFVASIGKLPLPCRSRPGFVVNRILGPYMMEALRVHEEGVVFETIDKAAKLVGMPTGPIELADRVGLDIVVHVAGILGAGVPEVLRAKVDAGELGAKTGQGFYTFKDGRPQKATKFAAPDDELKDRLMLILVNEAMAVYEDDVVNDLDLLDAGVIFGAGFAPFTGGPINYARQRGISEIVSRLEYLAERYGTQFTPRPGWSKLAATE